MKEKGIIREKSFAFALRIVKLNRFLTQKNEYVLSRQVLRCGTSIGANVEEANGSRTKKEFAQKLGSAYKDANETKYWLTLLKDSGMISVKEGDSMIGDCDELLKMLGSALKTLKSSLAAQPKS